MIGSRFSKVIFFLSLSQMQKKTERETYRQVTASHAGMKVGRAVHGLYTQTQPS